jgi:hypothetical protein
MLRWIASVPELRDAAAAARQQRPQLALEEALLRLPEGETLSLSRAPGSWLARVDGHECVATSPALAVLGVLRRCR